VIAKQVNHPIVTTSWSNDTNLSDPGEPWDTTVAKVDPGNGKRDDGWLPEESPAAQHTNYLLNEIGRWIQYLSGLQVIHWEDATKTWHLPGTYLADAESSCNAPAYDEGAERWIVGGGTGVGTAKAVSSRDLATFAENGLGPVSYRWTWAAAKRPDDAPSTAGTYRTLFGTADLTVAASVHVTEANGTPPGFAFSNAVLPSANNVSTYQGVWDTSASRWIVVGTDNTAITARASLWYATTAPLGAFTRVSPAATSTAVLGVAYGAGLLVAVGNGTSPAFDAFTSVNGGTSWTVTTPSGITAGEDFRAIAYDETRALFMMLTDQSCYVSSNGTTWTQRSTFASGGFFQFRCLATDGGIYVAAAEDDPPRIRYSLDHGATWRQVYVPPAEATTPIVGVAYSRIAKRFIATWNDADPPTAQGNIAASLAVGETFLGIGGYSVPQVP
jgi:hypothetical protein